MTIARNIGLWFGSVLLSVSLFSAVLAPGGFVFVFRITLMRRFQPPFCTCLFSIAFRNAEEGRVWKTLGSGLAIWPAWLAAWGLIVELTGGHSGWRGDDIGQGAGASLLFSLVVGFLTVGFYVTALKVVHRWGN